MHIVSAMGWLSVLGAAWYGLATGQGLSPAVIGVMGISALVGLIGRAFHVGDELRQTGLLRALDRERERGASNRGQNEGES